MKKQGKRPENGRSRMNYVYNIISNNTCILYLNLFSILQLFTSIFLFFLEYPEHFYGLSQPAAMQQVEECMAKIIHQQVARADCVWNG